MLNKKALKDLDVKGKRVLVRCDFNVPMDKEGNITRTLFPFTSKSFKAFL